MPDLTWASHPNATLRGRVADYLGRGYRIKSLDENSAVLSRPKRSSRLAWLAINPFYFVPFWGKRDDEVLISVDLDGEVRETRL